MKDLFLDLETSLEFKELGFKEFCIAYYYTNDLQNVEERKYDVRGNFYFTEGLNGGEYNVNSNKNYYVSAPLYSQIFDWVREKHGIHAEINSNYERYFTYDLDGEFQDEICSWKYSYKISWVEGSKDYIRTTKDLEKVTGYDDFKEAKIECIKQLIKLLK